MYVQLGTCYQLLNGKHTAYFWLEMLGQVAQQPAAGGVGQDLHCTNHIHLLSWHLLAVIACSITQPAVLTQ